jgi:hypothetical protein
MCAHSRTILSTVPVVCHGDSLAFAVGFSMREDGWRKGKNWSLSEVIDSILSFGFSLRRCLDMLEFECILNMFACSFAYRLLVSFLHVSVYEPELMHPKKNPNGRFPPNYPRWDDSSEKAKIEAAKAKIDKVRIF